MNCKNKSVILILGGENMDFKFDLFDNVTRHYFGLTLPHNIIEQYEKIIIMDRHWPDNNDNNLV